MAADPPHLAPLPERLRLMDPPPTDAVLALVEEEHARWRQLHDRLISLIAGLLDIAATDRPLDDVISRLIGEASVGLDELVGTRVDAGEVAALLRAHGSVGTVETDGATTTFRHACGSGGRYWRDNPATATVAEGEVPGVPAGRPRYCARCVRTIDTHGGRAWTVAPPAAPDLPCVWTVSTDITADPGHDRGHGPGVAPRQGPGAGSGDGLNDGLSDGAS
ncbi:hypothetical protein [Nonomuraea cavernae]|uniref:Uncharacterized protein n=1 Tax=Nonomuraea cavernae TaxID=2045107 RepID=A0A917ZDE7_9ACTN|nr:hypothetical protein [Nonomuraea cavernae]MCA2189774.1 hypothetical protein [Nonomuraea cavernae]GGO79894.1 hypothetical protein GCM10012289_65270 [Nonomuraea cavernae]